MHGSKTPNNTAITKKDDEINFVFFFVDSELNSIGLVDVKLAYLLKRISIVSEISFFFQIECDNTSNGKKERREEKIM